jgi:tryptophan 7-halogenase
MSNIVIAGRGATGWLTALYIHNNLPNHNITVVYDDKIPIIGVGESTTPNFLDFTLNCLDIPTGDFIRECEATLKLGIKFKNWKGDGSHYYHTFATQSVDYLCSALSKGFHIDEIDLAAQLCEINKIPKENFGVEYHGKDNKYEDLSIALHFNAKLMAEYLEKIAKKRGINTVIGNIQNTVLDDDGYVTELILDTKEKVEVDFVFDCTGFSRVFVDKVYKSPMDYFEHLPVKRAMPFFLDKTGPTPPYTEAIAMKYGWMWKIPVGDRYGCGYAFDSDLTTDEDVYKEICEETGQKPDIRKKIDFKAGYHTKPMNKNTLALGLAHGFLEPLEATSIMITIDMLNILSQTIPGGVASALFERQNRDIYIENYNKVVQKRITNCTDFVYLHYLTPRNDTEFWRRFHEKTPPKSLTKILNLINNYDVTKPNSLKTLKTFNRKSFIQCIAGVDMLDKDMIKRNTCEYTESEVCKLKDKNKYISKSSMDHGELLEEVIKNPDIVFMCQKSDLNQLR